MVEHRDEAFLIFVDGERSNPTHVNALTGRFGTPNATFQLSGAVGFIPDDARTSDLRDSYLAAFTLLGYRYALWPDLDTIRAQIRDRSPDQSLFRRADAPADLRAVLLLNEPVECVCVINTGGRCVFLPWPKRGSELTKWLRSGAPIGDLSYRVFPWPRRMEMLLDFEPLD